MNILLTGGAGYIGSHISVILSQAGYEVILFDNFSNSDNNVLVQLEKVLGKKLHCIEGDIRDYSLILKTLLTYKIEVVIHLAALKIIDESVRDPLKYYSNNMHGMINMLQAMNEASVRNLVFSSSAAVYGEPQYLPIDEAHPTNPTSPYGRTKLQAEQMLRDIAHSNQGWKILCLRYFNPVGAHESGFLGEATACIPTNLMPYIAKVAAKELPFLSVYGSDYQTDDGTGIRDYIHVMDIARGHLSALTFFDSHEIFEILNLGVGHGYSVLEVVKTYETVNKVEVPYKKFDRREADVGCCYASSKKAEHMLNWKALSDLEKICIDVYRWHNSRVD